MNNYIHHCDCPSSRLNAPYRFHCCSLYEMIFLSQAMKNITVAIHVLIFPKLTTALLFNNDFFYTGGILIPHKPHFQEVKKTNQKTKLGRDYKRFSNHSPFSTKGCSWHVCLTELVCSRTLSTFPKLSILVLNHSHHNKDFPND